MLRTLWQKRGCIILGCSTDYVPTKILFKVCPESNQIYPPPPLKPIPHGQNPLDGRWCHLSYTWKHFHTWRSCQYLAAMPRVQMCSVCSSDFHFHQTHWAETLHQVLTKALGYSSRKQSRRFSRLLAVVVPWTKLKSRKWYNHLKHGYILVEWIPFIVWNEESIEKVQ